MADQPVLVDDAYLTLDLADAGDRALAAYGDRVVRLLKSPAAERSHFFVATLDDFLGAVYALCFAKHNKPPFGDRPGPLEVPVIVKRAEHIAAGTTRLAGSWLAGFHFNSALFRIAATYHRGLKVVAGKEKVRGIWVADLLEIVEPCFQDWPHKQLDHIYNEVNQLKHDGGGIYFARKVTWSQAIASLGELIELFERWISKDLS
jgi:hypothetical protein